MAKPIVKSEIYAVRIIREGYVRDPRDSIEFEYDNFTSFGWFAKGSIKELTHHSFDLVSERLSNIKEIGLHRLQLEQVPDAVLYIKRGLKYNYLLAGSSSLMQMTVTYLFKLMSEKQGNEATRDREIQILLDDFNREPEKYQDKIDKIQKQLGDVKEIMHRNIEDVLNRGEKIDNLMIKADHLSQSSKTFYIGAKKLNRCCTIL
jgi:synaptobrevin family protein YKT6